MSALILQYPVYSLENQLLLPADTIINEKTLERLISSNKTPSYQSCSLMEHGTVNFKGNTI